VRPPVQAGLLYASVVSYELWLQSGINAGYCSEPYCAMHDIGHLTDAEAEDYYDGGGDFCVDAVRLLPPLA
jgi:hypothetical protein